MPETPAHLRSLEPWSEEKGVLCVCCPDCAFTYDALHEDVSMGGGYSCPACAEQRLTERLAAVEGVRDRLAASNSVGMRLISLALDKALRGES